MSNLWIEFVGWLVDFQILAAGLLAVALVAALCLRQPAARLAVLRPALVGLALLAVLSAAPGWSLVHLRNEQAQLLAASSRAKLATRAPASKQLALYPLVDPAPLANVAPLSTEEMPAAEPAAVHRTPLPASPTRDLPWLATPLAMDFIVGSVVVTAWLALGGWQTRGIVRRARPASAELVRLLGEIAAPRPAPRLLETDEIAVAAAVGVRRPVILLPAKLQAKDDAADGSELLRDAAAVLAHEWAHVGNRDLRTIALVRWLLPLLWSQPLFWLVRRLVRLDQETLADAAAAELTSRADYAERLVAWARRSARTARPPRLAAAAGLWESPSQLKRRVMLLLDEKFTVLRECSRRWKAACTAAVSVLAILLSQVTLQPAPADEGAATSGEADAGGVSLPAVATKKIPGGGAIEVLAIGTHGEVQPIWWDATGRSLTKVPFEARMATNISPTPNRQVVFRTTGLTAAAHVIWATSPATSTGEGKIVVAGQVDPPGYCCHAFDRNGDRFSLKVGVATGNWTDVAEGNGAMALGMIGVSIVFSKPMLDSDGQAVVVVSENLRDCQTRLIAETNDGKQHEPSRRGGVAAGALNQTNYEFAGIKPADVKRVVLQKRTYRYVEFKDLPTGPTKKGVQRIEPAEQQEADRTKNATIPNFKIRPPTFGLTSPHLESEAKGEVVEAAPADSQPSEGQSQWSLQVLGAAEEGKGATAVTDKKATANATAGGSDEAPAATLTSARSTAVAPADAAAREFFQDRRPEANVVEGLCVDEAGQPLAGVEVSLYLYASGIGGADQKPAERIAVATTADDGRYRFDKVIDAVKVYPNGVPDENFQEPPIWLVAALCRKQGYATGWDNAPALHIVKYGHTPFARLLPAATLRGRVLDGGGRPVTGAAVTTNRYVRIPGVALAAATTDDNGRFEIRDVEAYDREAARKAHEAHIAQMLADATAAQKEMLRATSVSGSFAFQPTQVYVSHPRYVTATADVPNIPGEVEVKLSPGATLTGRVVRPAATGDEPAAGCVVSVEPVPKPQPKTPSKAGGSNSFTAFASFQAIQMSVRISDAAGAYRVDSLPPGEYRVAVTAVADWVAQGIDSVSVKAGESTTAPEVKLTKGGVVRVQLVDAETGQPLEFPKPRKGWLHATPRDGRPRPLENGIVEFSSTGTAERRLAPGKYSILATLPNEGPEPWPQLTSIPKDLPPDQWPTFEVGEGLTVETKVSMRSEDPRMATGTALFSPSGDLKSVEPPSEKADSPADKKQGDAAPDAEPGKSSARDFRRAEQLVANKKYADAIAAYEALAKDESEPQQMVALNNLAHLLATCPDVRVRNGLRAVDLAREALALVPSEGARGELLDTLGAAYWEAGDYDASLATLRQALDAAGDDPMAKAKAEATLNRYEAAYKKQFSGAGEPVYSSPDDGLNRKPVDLRIVDERGQPIPNVEVRVFRADRAAQRLQNTVASMTNNEGRKSFGKSAIPLDALPWSREYRDGKYHNPANVPESQQPLALFVFAKPGYAPLVARAPEPAVVVNGLTRTLTMRRTGDNPQQVVDEQGKLIAGLGADEDAWLTVDDWNALQ